MATIPGTSLYRFKDALIDELKTRLTNVVYASPTTAEELIGSDGSGLAVWWSDDASADLEPVVFVSTTERWVDETVTCTLVVQAIGADTDDTQDELDESLTNALGQAIDAVVFLDVTDDTTVQTFDAMPTGWQFPSGALGTRRAGRFELAIQINARIKLS